MLGGIILIYITIEVANDKRLEILEILRIILNDFLSYLWIRLLLSATSWFCWPNAKDKEVFNYKRYSIFQLGVEALRQVTGKTPEELPANDILVVGDSYSKDILPATTIGCQTVWLKGIGWGEEKVDESVPTHIINHIKDLPAAIQQE